jgi:hypothetical protein
MIGAFYQAYNKPRCVDFVLSNFRKHYPDTDVVLISDGGNDFSDIAAKYKCMYFYEQNLSGDMSDKSKGLASSYFHSSDVLVNYVLRFGKYIQNIKNKKIMILEDDVYVIQKTSSDTPYDLNGINLLESLPEPVCMYLKNISKIPYGGCGGCILKTEFFQNILKEENKKQVVEQVNKYCSLTNERWASDSIISYICVANGGSMGVWDGLGETWQKDLIPRLNNKTVDVIHQYKNFY